MRCCTPPEMSIHANICHQTQQSQCHCSTLPAGRGVSAWGWHGQAVGAGQAPTTPIPRHSSALPGDMLEADRDGFPACCAPNQQCVGAGAGTDPWPLPPLAAQSPGSTAVTPHRGTGPQPTAGDWGSAVTFGGCCECPTLGGDEGHCAESSASC